MTDDQKNWYLDPRWQKYRLNRLNKAGWECEECGDKTSTLHIHHTFYRPGRKPWQYPFSTTRVLCKGCHKAEHGRSSEYDVSDAQLYSAYQISSLSVGEQTEKDEWVFFENGKWTSVQRPSKL